MAEESACVHVDHLTSSCTVMSKTSLAEFSTCEISDALIKLSVPHGGHIPDIHMLSPATSNCKVKLCGPAYTVQMVLASSKDAPRLSKHFVDTAPPGSVIVIDAPKGFVLLLLYPLKF